MGPINRDLTGPARCQWPGCGRRFPVASLARAHEQAEHLEDGEQAAEEASGPQA